MAFRGGVRPGGAVVVGRSSAWSSVGRRDSRRAVIGRRRGFAVRDGGGRRLLWCGRWRGVVEGRLAVAGGFVVVRCGNFRSGRRALFAGRARRAGWFVIGRWRGACGDFEGVKKCQFL